MKKHLKILIDILMFVLFLYLMSYHPGMGLRLHALLGMTLFVLFIIHNVLNFQWYRSLFKGKYNIYRTTLTISNILLLISMFFLILSSFMISNLVFNISFLPINFYWSSVHKASSAWGFMLTTVHLGMHLRRAIKACRQKFRNTAFEYVEYLAEFLLCSFGVYSFIRSGLGCDMLMIEQHLPTLPPLQFYLEYISIVLAVSIIIDLSLNIAERNFEKKSAAVPKKD